MPPRVDDAGQAVRQLLDAVRDVAHSDAAGWRMADDLMRRYPQSLDRVDQFIGDQGMRLGRHLGSGAESLVWEVKPRTGPNSHVLKVRAGDADVSDFDLPEAVPGVAPYWAREQAGPNVAAAIQPKADVVFRPMAGWEKPFSQGAERLRESLLARGWHWADGHKWNVGVMPDGTWGAVDGFVDRAHPAWTRPNISPEEAVRMLRLTPDERAAIYGVKP